MKIWHEDLIDKLCDQHLLLMWKDCWVVFKIVTNRRNGNKLHPTVIEFSNAIIYLVYILNLVYGEMHKRGYTVRKNISPWDIDDAPATRLVKEMKHYTPAKSKEAQIAYLKEKGCCKI